MESDEILQNKFLELYKSASYENKNIRACCQKLGINKTKFTEFLADPEFENKFFALRRLTTYELEEVLSNKVFNMISNIKSMTKDEIYSQSVAQKTALELLKKLNRERYGDRSEVSIEHKGQIVPQININLIPHESKAIDITPKTKVIDNKKPLNLEVNPKIGVRVGNK